MYAYSGKILHIDLTTQHTWVEEKSPEFLKKYIGGVGLATRLLYDNTPAGCDPLGPENALCLACSAFAGTTVPVGTKHGIATKSPLTGFIGDSIEDLIEAVGDITEIRPETCRQHVADNFSVDKMVEGYEEAYKRVLYGFKKAIIAKDVMTVDVVTASPEMSREDLVKILARYDVSGVPVLSDGRLVGIVTEDDILSKQGEYVSEIMTRNVITVNEKDPVHRVASILIRNRIKRVPVMSDDHVAGVISRHDLVQALALEKYSAAA